MRLVLDTSILIDHLRGDKRAVKFLTRAIQDGHELWSVTVVRTEILAGMRRGEEGLTYALLGALRWQEVNCEVADRAGEFARHYLKTHPGVDTVDHLVAAGTYLLGGQLVTQNIKHFPMLPGLTPAYS